MKNLGLWLFILASVGLFPQDASADVSGRYENLDEDSPLNFEMTVEADDLGNVRMHMAGGSQYYLIRDDIMYVVTVGHEDTTVMKLEDMLAVQMEAMARIGWSQSFEATPAPNLRFIPMQEETVGSRTGMGYGIVSEEQEKPVYASIVISDDPDLAKLGEAIARANESSVKGMGSMATMLQLMNSDMLALFARGAPIRMLGVELTDTSTDTIPYARFELPTEPLTTEEVRKLIISPKIAPPPTLPSRNK